MLKSLRMSHRVRSRIGWGRRGAVVVLSLVMLSGASSCGAPSADEIKKEFEEYVAGANSCKAADECAIASAACPLGCFVAVRSERKADVEAKARKLIADYERGGQACAYGCIQPGPVTCTAGRCAAEPTTTP